ASMTGVAPLSTERAEGPSVSATLQAQTLAAQFDDIADFDLNVEEKVTQAQGNLFLGRRPLPPLPEKLSPSHAARLADMLDFLHRQLTAATENIRANDEGTQVTLGYADWQRVLSLQMLLSRYVRAVADPESLDE